MKNVIIGILIVALFGVVLVKSENENKEYFRIHIQSNSLSEKDENAKFLVKEKVNKLIEDVICNSSSKDDLVAKLRANIKSLTLNIDNYLSQQGFDYASTIEINNEYFPTRSYKGYVVESGFYDALTIKLGKAEGDNWWCVLYPPLCLNNQNQSIKIKSRIKNIIEGFFDKKESV